MNSTLTLPTLMIATLLLMSACSSEDKAPSETASAASEAVSEVPASEAPASAAASQMPSSAQSSVASAVVPEPNVTSAPQLSYTPESSPAILFQKCAACHGNHAEKSALNQSAVIGEWDSKRIADAIIGYQDGTYGGAMKTLMVNQVKDLSKIQIEALSEYIANLYVKTH